MDNLPQKVEEFKFQDWTFTFTSGQSILSSACTCGSSRTDTNDRGDHQRCDYCRFSTALKYPNRPDMVFHKNSLRVMHRGGASVHFDALAALDQVGQDAPESSCHVAASDVWRQARAMSEYLSNVLRTHDWTYSSMFIGDLVGFQVIATEEPLDLDRLRQPEPILFYAHIPLYEDELADHGCSKMELKLRCMPSGFLILLSHYLRVDGVLIRLLETRYRHLYGRTYVLRERTLKRSNFNQLTSAQLKMVMNPELLSANLSPMSVISERLHF